MEIIERAGNGLLMETAARIHAVLGREMDEITVERAVIGLFFSGVKLSTGHGGICFTPVKEIPEAVCCPSSVRAMPNSGKLRGQPVTQYIQEMGGGSPLKKALGIAVLNALSSICWSRTAPTDYLLEQGLDPLDQAVIPDEAAVVVIGALVPYLRMLKQRGRPFHILEKDAHTLKPDEMPFFAPADQADQVISASDWLIITGTTLINDTLEGILDRARPGANITLVGPIASMLPEAFFSRGITAIGGISVTHPDQLLDTLVEAGSGYHFYGKSARICEIKARYIGPPFYLFW